MPTLELNDIEAWRYCTRHCQRKQRKASTKELPLRQQSVPIATFGLELDIQLKLPATAPSGPTQVWHGLLVGRADAHSGSEAKAVPLIS